MGSYPCSNCGARADTVTGCPECGRTVAQEIAALSKVITNMQFRNRDMVEARTLLMKRLQGAIATRSLLVQAHEVQQKAGAGPLRRVRPAPSVAFGGARSVVPPRADPAQQPPEQASKPGQTRKSARRRGRRPAGPPPAPPPGHHPPEASTLSMQNVVLWLGALLFAVTGTGYLLRNLGGISRVLVFAVLAGAVLAGAILVARRGLRATAETIASVGLLFVLLAGFAVWSVWFIHSGLPGTVYAGLVCLMTAGVAAGYRNLSHLRSPRYATVLLLQPVFPLLFGHALQSAVSWAGVLALVALEDLVLALVLRARPDGERYLEDAAWTLHGAAVVGAVAGSAGALAQAHTANAALAGAAALLLAGSVALAGGLTVQRRPLEDIGSGVATLSVIGAIGRLAAVTLPGRGLVSSAVAVLLVAIGVRYLPNIARRGPQLAGALAAGTLGLAILGRGADAVAAPVRAALPVWKADLTGYAHQVATAAGPDSWQLALAALILTVAAVIMLPPQWRDEGAVAGGTLTVLLVPAAFHLPWALAPVLPVAAAIAVGAYGLAATSEQAAWVRIGAAILLGFYATGISLARPSAGAFTLTALAVAGAMIGTAPRLAFATSGRGAQLAAEAALGGAAFALPGAVAFATAALAPPDFAPGPILAASYLAVAGTLSATAIAQVARATSSPLPTIGATLGAIVVALIAFLAPHVVVLDKGVAVLLLIGAILLVVAPSMDVSGRLVAGLDGSDVAAMGVTTAAIAALSRVAALLVPRYPLATVAGLVLAVALGVRGLPAEWRRGPIVGSTLVGGFVAVLAGIGAITGAVDALRAVQPVWHTNLATWSAHPSHAPGPQVPVALLLLALAALVVLPKPASQAVSVALGGLAVLAIPSAFDLPWWSPIALSGLVSTVAGIAAARSLDPTVSMARAAVATVLFANTVGASLVRPDTTATTLFASALIYATVAGTAIRTYRDSQAEHLARIGGMALAGAMINLAGAAGCAAAAADEPLGVALTAALAGLCLGLAVTGVTVDDPAFLPYATAGVALGGTAIAAGTINTKLPVEVYAATTALLCVLAELLRAAAAARRTRRSGSGLRDDRPIPVQRLPHRQRYALLLAAGPATMLAVVRLAPSLAAALVGPYHWVDKVWTGPPHDSLGTLGSLASWVGGGSEVLAAMLLTLAGVLGAIGFGGSVTAVEGRAVASVLPGLAVTLLIAPYALRAPWPAGPLAAVAVAVLTGLGVALTPTPPDTLAAEPLRAARRIVLVICVAAGAAGLAGALATQGVTLSALTVVMLAGLVAGLYGLTRRARVTGWLVTTSAGQVLALVIGAVAGLPTALSGYLVGVVAGGLLIATAVLPRLQRAEAAIETTTVEVSSYAGGVLGLVLAARSLPHLAAFACAWGAVLGVAAAKPGRPRLYRSSLIWLAAAYEVGAWWLLMTIGNVGVPEAYTLAVAVVALITGYFEQRRHPEISSWVSYGIALVAAFLPSLAIVLATGQTPLRRALLIIAAAITVGLGAWRRQQAPVVVGGVALAVAALHELAVVSTAALLWTVMAFVGAGLVALGANFEKRRRDLMRLRGALGRLR